MIRRRTIFAGAAFAASVLVLTGCSGGGEPEQPASEGGADYGLVAPGTLTVCSDVPYPPFEVEDADAESGYSGFDIDLLGAIAEKLDLSLAVQDVNFDALQSGTSLVAGQCDIGASAMTITEERR